MGKCCRVLVSQQGPGAGEGPVSLAVQRSEGCGFLALRSAPESCFLFQLPAPKAAQEMPRHSASRRPSEYCLLYVCTLFLSSRLGRLLYTKVCWLALEVPYKSRQPTVCVTEEDAKALEEGWHSTG